MNIALFNRLSWIRPPGKQRNVQAYMAPALQDFGASLHIHPTGSHQMPALPVAPRKLKRIHGHGTEPLLVADEKENRKGDMLWYRGDWYECVSSMLYDHTILNHYNYQFVLAPHDASGSIDLEPPVGNPVLPGQAEDQPDAPSDEDAPPEAGGDGP